jgi:cystathionine beta-lyase
MKFDFDVTVDRSETSSEKWCYPGLDLASSPARAAPIPMWVADMDFRAPPVVLEALADAVSHGVFGYSYVSKTYTESVINWQQNRFNWAVDPAWVLQTAGVVAALSQIIRAFTAEGDGVLMQMPVYGRFHKTPRTTGRVVVNAPLMENGSEYLFDPEVFEAVIKEHAPKLFILCHPHNPVGKVWTEDELRTMGEICIRHKVLVVSDEIHQDLVFNRQKKHIPFASLGEKFAQNSITCTAPSKTFNLAGLQVSNIFVPNPLLRERLSHELDANGNHGINTLGMIACEAAYRHGAPWLESLLDYIEGNHQYFSTEIQKHMPVLKLFNSDALYLAWLDCRGLQMADKELYEFMLHEAGVWFDSGVKFGAGGEGFMRVNLGCTRVTLINAVSRMRGVI